MSLRLQRAEVSSLDSSRSLAASQAPARGLRLFLAALLACSPALATAQQPAAVQSRIANSCANDGPRPLAREQQRGALPLHLCEGYALGTASSQIGHGEPLALASADFDEDGVPDLVSAFGTSSTGSVTVYRGNIAALWPYGAAIANGTPHAFLPGARTFAVDEAPDLLVTGDFDADGHLDIVTAKRGSASLYFLKGDGHGGFANAKRVPIAGAIRDLIAGEINRSDGLADLIVAVSGPAGYAALVYESPRGALQGEPEVFPLGHPAEALALGRFTGGAMLDLAIGGGNAITVVQGRDRHLSTGGGAPSAVVTHQMLSFGVRAITAGDFTGRGPSIAILGDDGSVHVMEHALAPDSLALKTAAAGPAAAVGSHGSDIHVPGRSAAGGAHAQAKLSALHQLASEHDAAAEWTERSTVALPGGFSQNVPRLVSGRISGSAQEDLLVVDSSNNQIHILSTGRGPALAQAKASGISGVLPQMKKLASLDAVNAPVAALPMRLSQHGLSGLVTLHAGEATPSVSPQDVPPSSVFTVTNTSDIASAGDTNIPAGSLRAAITAASHAAAIDSSNNNGVASQVFSVVFNIPTTDPGYNAATRIWTIKPMSEAADDPGNQFEDRHALPAIYSGITIDGYTQPGASPNTLIAGDNAKIVIAIDGGNATTPGGDGLDAFLDVGSVIRGLAITGWDSPVDATVNGHAETVGGYGIALLGEADFVEGNFIGTPDGKTAGRNYLGVFVDSGPAFGDTASGNLVGGTTPQARNVISANVKVGVFLQTNAVQAAVQGNFIGLDSSGTSCLGNLDTGITGLDATNTIGGTIAGARNIISCNGTEMDINDLLDQGVSTGGTLQGNYFGTDATGTKGLSPKDVGVGLNSNVRNYVIGGTTPAARNVISGANTGISITDNTFYITVQGNYIGTDPTGTIAVPNAYGVYAGRTDASKTYAGYATIGGTVAGSGNVISGNTHDGVDLYGTSADNPGYSPYIGSTVLGNFVGTDATGTKSLPNGGNGVYLLEGATNNTIGGTVSGAANMIANNGANGVLIDPGTTDFPGVNNVTIGNIITTNTGAGVRIASGTQNRVSQNSIYGNGALGIDIDATGPSTNTHCNATNSGANNIENYPVLTAGSGTLFISATATDPNGNTSEFSKAVAATKTGNLLSLLGNFDGTANTAFNIEFFSSPTADASGYGEGQTYLGSTTVSTDASCNSTISDPVDTTQADLSVTLKNPTADLLVGPDMGSITYTAAVSNLGPATAHNVTFVDTLPSQLQLSNAYCNVAACQSPIVSSQGACTISGQTITCKLGTLPTGGTANITFPVQVLSDGSVTNTANVSATEADPNLLNNTSSPTATAYYPYPSIDHLSVAAALTNSPALEVDIYGTGLVSASTVTFNGTTLPVTGLVDNQVCGSSFSPSFCSALQVQIPANLLTTAGTYTVEVSNPGDQAADTNFVVASSCTYSLDSSFITDVSAEGANETVYVTPNVPTCPYTATSSLSWVTVLDNPSGTGSATIDIAFAPNTTTSARSGTITVAGQSRDVSQEAGSATECSAVLNPSGTSIAAAGGSGSFTVTETPSSCTGTVEAFPQDYSYAPNVQWITIPNNLVPANNTVTYTVAPNNGPARTGSITVGGAAYVITQAAPACVFTLSPTSEIAPASGGTGTIGVTAAPSTCAWTATSSDSTRLSITSGKSGTGNGTVSYKTTANTAGPQTPTITIGNSISSSVFTLNQASATTCTFALSPGTATIGANGGSGFIELTASFGFCQWTAASNNPDSLSINGSASGTGTTSILYNVSQNTGAARTLTITAGCQTFTINQAAAVTTIPNNPVPTITTLSPASVTAGAGATTLTVSGTNFLSGSTVSYNGTAKTTTYVSATKLTIALLATDVAIAGSYPVTVTNPTPGGGTSNSVNFTVTAAVVNNPVPTITTLSPNSVTAGAGATTLTINGTNFISGSVVNFNGTAKTTTYVSATKLTIALLATDVAIAGSYPVTVTNPTPGGGTSNSVNFTVTAAVVNNPVPTITTLSPNSVTAGVGAATLTINGTNFISGSTVSYNGTAKTTTYVSATQLTAALLATDVATAGTYPVTVTNPTPGGGTSNSVNFTVNAAVVNNPVPTITTLSPNSVTAGAGATNLTINGTNFISGSVVNFNGTAKTATYVSATQLTAALLATDVATAGTYPVTVTNPTPGGGTSNSVNFTVNAAVVLAPAVTFSPTTLSFPATPSGTPSAAQIVTLTNTGSASLNISGLTITGTNAAVFTQTNNCAATLAASESCTISVVFTPSSVAAFTASISLADDASASPQTVILTGVGEAPPSFTISSTTPAQTVTAGGAAQYSLTITPQGGPFPGTVTLSASGLPAGATATFNPGTLSPGSSSISTQLIIQTAATAPQTASLGISCTLTLASLPFFALLLAIRRRGAAFTRLALVILLVTGAATALTGCGGGFSLASSPTVRTYNITITGTSGAEQQSTTVQLTVK